MAFTATINAISRTETTIAVTVTFADSGTGWNIQKIIDFIDDGSVTAAAATQTITDMGTVYKNNLARNVALQAKVGTVITI